MSTSAILDRIRTLLGRTPPFNLLPEHEREDVLLDLSIEYFNAGEVILEQGSTHHPGLYIVESGLVRLMDTFQQRLIDKVGEGDHFGSFGLIKGGGAIYEAKAIDPTVCALVRSDRFQRLYEKYDDFAAHFDSELRMYVRRMGSAIDVTGAHLLFSRALNQFSHRRLVTCDSGITARRAAQRMRTEGVDSLLVMQGGKLLGILTDSDLRNGIVGQGASADTPIRKVMSAPAITVGGDATLYDAMMTMLAERVHRVVIVDPVEPSRPIGVITDRDIAHFRALDPVATASRIDNASSFSELARIRVSTSEQLLNLYRQEARPEMLNRLMMEFYDRLVIRILNLVEEELRESHPDESVGLRWSWVRLGSGGRREMALNSEQHNALIYEDPADEAEHRRAERWFNRISEGVNQALTDCGFQPSEYVARDARWRRPMRDWRRAYREWILQSDETSLLPVPIFFDLRCVFGEGSFVRDLKSDIVDALNVQAMDESRTFLRMMAANAIEAHPPTGLLRKMLDRVVEGRHSFDVRDGGILPIVDAARVLALETRYFESTNTFDRLRHAARELPELERVVEDALEGYQYLVDFRLESQLRAVEAGDPPVNQIDASSLNKLQQRLLRNAFARAADLQEALARRYQLSRKWRIGSEF